MRKEAVKAVLQKDLNIPPERINEVLKEMKNSMVGKHDGRQPPPVGGISLRAAERRYGIKHETISLWIRRGYIPSLLRTKNERYVNENQLAQLINAYKQNPGRGKRTIKQILTNL